MLEMELEPAPGVALGVALEERAGAVDLDESALGVERLGSSAQLTLAPTEIKTDTEAEIKIETKTERHTHCAEERIDFILNLKRDVMRAHLRVSVD